MKSMYITGFCHRKSNVDTINQRKMKKDIDMDD